MTTNYTITNTTNGSRASVEIYFTGKPAEHIRTALKAEGFRWHGVKKCWYGYTDPVTADAIITAAEEDAAPLREGEKAPKAETAEKREKGTPQAHIRFYWNGIKVDGGKLRKCYYNADDDGESVTIYDDYGFTLPRDLFDVKNETDLYTDYFDNDSATLDKSHPLFAYALYCARKADARSAARYSDYLKKQLSGREPFRGAFDYYKKELAEREERIARFEAMTDPGQPTAEDLEAIDRARKERENAEREAEHERELEERERFLNRRAEAHRLIDAESTAHPVEDGAPVVVVEWSEHPGIDECLRLSVPAAENVLRKLDESEAETRGGRGGYYKTSFRIEWTDDSGEPCSYAGRYDIGDNDGGLVSHIRAFGEWHLTHDNFGHETPDPETENDITRLADWLGEIVEEKKVS